MKAYTRKELLEKVKRLPNFKLIPQNYWILGVRSKADKPDTFDDRFYLFYGETLVLVTTGTTNAGLAILKKGWMKLNKDGAFVLKSDIWHYNLWKVGHHKKVMRALVQNVEVVGYRDNNNNDKSEEIGKEVKGWFGINFHCNSYKYVKGIISWVIGGWSAGCQVCNNLTHYYEIVDLTTPQGIVSYCLINEFE